MSEQYVSKAALTEAVYLSMHDNPHKDGKIRVNHNNEHRHFVNMIYHAPSADVRPVVHARWVWTVNGEEDYEQYWVCSRCNEHSFHKTPYCSDCGACMDLESEGTDE